MAKKLEFDLERLVSMRDKVGSLTEELTSLNNDLQKQMDDLRMDWNTPAGKKFYEEQDMNWSSQVLTYVNTLDTLKFMLDQAIIYYREAGDKADALSFR